MTPLLLNEAFSANKIPIIIYKRVFRAAVNTYVSLPIFRGLDARGGKSYEQAHTHTRGTTTVTAIIMKSTKVQTLGVILVQLYSSIIIKFTPIGSSNVDRHIDRVSVAA